MAQHHLGREDQRARIDLIQTCILGSSAVRCLKNGHFATDVSTGRNTNTADFCSQCIRNIVAIEIERGDNRVFIRTHQDLLQKGICNHILDNDLPPGSWVGQSMPRATSQRFGTKTLHCQFITPVFKGALGIFHNITLVHQSDRWQVIIDGVLNRFAHQPTSSLF